MTTIPVFSPKGQHTGVWMIPRGSRRMAVPQRGPSHAVVEAGAEGNVAGIGIGTGLEHALDPNNPYMQAPKMCSSKGSPQPLLPHPPQSNLGHGLPCSHHGHFHCPGGYWGDVNKGGSV